MSLTSQTKTVTSVFDLKLESSATHGLIICQQYWPGNVNTGQGGVFTPSRGAVDNVRRFASANPAESWERITTGRTMRDAGCVSGAEKLVIFQNPLTAQAPMPLVSDKFPSVAAALAWFPGARNCTLADSINWVALQHALTLGRVTDDGGLYRFNRPIEYFTGLQLSGAGAQESQTAFVFDADNAFAPRKALPEVSLFSRGSVNASEANPLAAGVFASPAAGDNYRVTRKGSTAFGISLAVDDFVYYTGTAWAKVPNTEIYKRGMLIEGIRCVGTAVPVPSNTVEPAVGNAVAYNENFAGFVGYRRDPILTNPEAQEGRPLVYDSEFKKLSFDRFAGSGFTLLNGYNNLIEQVNCDGNKGYALHTNDGNSTIHRRCYSGRYNARGGIWAEGGGIYDTCNGYDFFDNTRVGILAGKPGNPTRCNLMLIGGNIEGVARCIDHHGDGGTIDILGTAIQYWSNDNNYPPIRIHGGGNSIHLNPGAVGHCGNSPGYADNNLKDLIWSRGLDNAFSVQRPLRQRLGDHTSLEVGATGTSAVALGAPDHKPLAMDRYRYISGLPGTSYGDYAYDKKKSRFPLIVLGGNLGMATVATVDVTTSLPTIAANPGIYLNVNASATQNNQLFLKTGKGVGGWSRIATL